MDLKVGGSPEATGDLESVAEYVARDSASYARAVVADILALPRDIPEFPLIGRIVPEMGNAHMRERLVCSDQLVCGIAPQRILVVAVIHGKRLPESAPERFE